VSRIYHWDMQRGAETGHDVRMDGRKWRNRPHWQFAMQRLGEDEHGTWLAVPAGTLARRGRHPHPIEHGFVMLVPTGAWWTAEFYRAHPSWELYVNVGTPCEWRPGSVRQVDLDLDVVRDLDGGVEVLDEDEFTDHQVRFAYPQELIAAARVATDDVVRLVAERREPFDLASRRWLRELG
jgi:hypothetical protein